MARAGVRASAPGDGYVVRARGRGIQPSADGRCKAQPCPDEVGASGRWCERHEQLFARVRDELENNDYAERARAGVRKRMARAAAEDAVNDTDL